MAITQTCCTRNQCHSHQRNHQHFDQINKNRTQWSK
ncbi:Uncharacterised protein [Vibrio cholerae]|nr:Uncharacterised protein [Vibrio cholerae]